ncbi:hypothetical protein M413DRAFT_27108 [Hebeloma cylindrosporum]|uniref:phosphatidylinositol-3,4,5-trisphosphate 3-phosphatase n=1 Tax=Hebeloma cylindrosporum TaxID=76867 RepID=A0A0C3CDL4_HEBCY|nr:hypothetical protein M413DRAFT_27108 [Hebeloma cylindrosporum h7]
MADYIRRVVSGSKARFKDDILGLELDLVYVTDQVIIMGYPASGIEGLYRNRREDAVKFLNHRHGKNFWVFNFCPIKENSYEGDVFEGRVSRYPFPDHQRAHYTSYNFAPPLVIMPLVAREMNAWLNGSHDRVAVLHCKAGKGRSGTMACAYLLSLEHSPVPPRLERSYSVKQWATRRMESAVDSIPHDDTLLSPPHSVATLSPPLVAKHAPSDTEGILDIDSGAVPPRSPTPNREKSFTDALKGVLDLHTARRMKSPEGEEKVKQGVSIPSQRRFLYYWTLLLAHEAPKHMWAVDPVGSMFQRTKEPSPKRMHETSTVKRGIVRMANKVIEKTNMAKGPAATAPSNSSQGSSNGNSSSSGVWASLARYDDTFIDLLEQWEVYTRDPGGQMGKRRPGSEHLTTEGSTREEEISRIFEDGKWDRDKMVRRFAQMGVISKSDEKSVDENGDKINMYTLRPLSEKRWEGLKHELDNTATSGRQAEEQETLKAIDENATKAGISRSEANSMYDLTSPTTPAAKEAEANVPGLNLGDGVVLDAGREVRIKLYMGQVFMGWLWFVPTFHMPQPPPSPGSPPSTTTKTTLLLTRKELDFPLGLGSAIIDVEIEMEWVVPPATGGTRKLGELQVPAGRRHTEASQIGGDGEPGTSALAMAAQVAVGGAHLGDVREAVEGRQGTED